jgi:hypothetical protein
VPCKKSCKLALANYCFFYKKLQYEIWVLLYPGSSRTTKCTSSIPGLDIQYHLFFLELPRVALSLYENLGLCATVRPYYLLCSSQIILYEYVILDQSQIVINLIKYIAKHIIFYNARLILLRSLRKILSYYIHLVLYMDVICFVQYALLKRAC